MFSCIIFFISASLYICTANTEYLTGENNNKDYVRNKKMAETLALFNILSLWSYEPKNGIHPQMHKKIHNLYAFISKSLTRCLSI